ncbi:glycosyltransferase [Zobellia galactanivorans]|uniref:Glycosyltransferase, family GT4 n=1 Tax=Zobellia galactanivorans (strain DSM 12802 / CCUG 47099 / CIP 106680 / NCIMB 13871 / Dsij) TaxID=63186 RepID=G0L598_ZOBGA|nr:glycosyltransferase [Zobellia galactanivorans]MDO6809968.1 glycosyltransferase [Zobellia galactanivorans]CAZ96058.1 Glycosyltransferase, family GT4 [Zobellia galactanivorans]
MKIIFLIDNLRKGGKERRMLELVKGLSKDKTFNLEVVIFKDIIEYPIVHDLNVRLHIIERKPKYSPAPFFKVYKICREFKPDIIHSWSTMCTLFAIPSSLLLNIKLINGNIAKAPRKLSIWHKELFLAKLSFIFSDVVIGNSSAGLKAYRAPKSKSKAIKNGFDFKRIQHIEEAQIIRKKYNIKTDIVIAKVAAFANRKDYDTYISAAQIVLSSRKDVTFLAIGSGTNLEQFKKKVQANGEENIIFTGPVQDIESLVSIINVGILSTNDTVHGEGISNSILEYMALAKPVIATRGGGTDEIVLDDETGYLIPPKSPQAMANKIIELINNPEKSSEMGLKGKCRIEKHFNLEHMTDMYKKVYEEILS